MSTTPAAATSGLSPARARVLAAVARHRSRAVTLNELADVVGGHPSTVRQHLASLVAAGLLADETVVRSTAGRRPRAYRLTEAGRRELSAAADADGYREIVRALAASHAADADAGETQARRIGATWGRQRVAEAPAEARRDPWRATVGILDAAGFSPAPARGDAADAVVLRSCPLLDVARESPGFVCPLHEEMARAVMTGLGDDRDVDLLPFASPDGCLLRLRAA